MNALDKIRQAEQTAEQEIAAAHDAAAAALVAAKREQKDALEKAAREQAVERELAITTYEKELEKQAAAIVADGKESAATISASFAAKREDLAAIIKNSI